MPVKRTISHFVHVLAAMVLASGIADRALALPAVQFETEILSLSLTGAGTLPFPDSSAPGGIAFIPITLEIAPTPGTRHLGMITAVDTGTGDFAVDSFFDVFFDVTFRDPSGAPLLALPGLHNKVTSHWVAPPDPLGHFPPIGQHFLGSDTLLDVPIPAGGTSFFDVFYEIDLVFDARGGATESPDGFHFRGGASALFNGNIEGLGFGPFALAGPFELRVREVPVPGALWLLGLGLGALTIFRLRRPGVQV